MTDPEPEPAPTTPRVLIVCRNLSVGAGGMERTGANLANHLASAGHETGLAYRHNPDSPPLYSVSDDVTRFSVAGDTASLLDVAHSSCPDVIVYFYATHDDTVHIVGLAQTGIPVVLHEGSNPWRVIDANWAQPKGLTRAQARLERLALLSMCTRIRFTLPVYLESLPPALRRDAVAFPNAFAPADPADMGLRARQERKIFLNIGGLKSVKNVMAAVEAFAMIADRLPDWDFHIFSRSKRRDPVRPVLEDLIARAGLAGRVKLFDLTPRIGREYGRSHIHVIASKEEGLPNCVAEAATHALPSIGFACCSGTNSMIVPEHTGLLAECGDNEVTNLAAAMLRMAEDDEARDRWGQNALVESGLYDPAHIFAQWESLIRDAARHRRSPEELHRHRYGDSEEGDLLRQVQKASLSAPPWPAAPPHAFDRAPPRVSIIVPVYNKEVFLAETLQSIADCPYPAREVIVVDDASTDGSAAILTDFCEREGWTSIRHEANRGVSAARNTGLDAATGEYIHFWDADDIYASEGIEELLRAMWDTGADIGTGVATRDGAVMARYAKSMRQVPAVTYGADPASLATASSSFKVYRSAFLRALHLRFQPGLDIEDSEFNLRAFPLAERITLTTAILGDYRLVEGSGARRFYPARYDSALKIEELTHDFYARNGLHALEARRRQHVLDTVLPMFVQHAHRNHMPIDAETAPQDLDFEFLARLKARMARLGQGLHMLDNANPRVVLAYFAIREGYLIWLRDFLSNRAPAGDVAACLAAGPRERALLRRLLAELKPATASPALPGAGLRG